MVIPTALFIHATAFVVIATARIEVATALLVLPPKVEKLVCIIQLFSTSDKYRIKASQEIHT
ncbi:MAG: hypothetical protein ACK5UE_08455, partial [Chitinophagales bacterium]